MKKLASKTGAVLTTLYLLLALYLFYAAWNCTTMLCDILLTLLTIPTFLVTTFLFGLIGMGEPSIAHVSGLYGALDVAAVSFNILGNSCLVYLIGLAIERLILVITRWLRR